MGAAARHGTEGAQRGKLSGKRTGIRRHSGKRSPAIGRADTPKKQSRLGGRIFQVQKTEAHTFCVRLLLFWNGIESGVIDMERKTPLYDCHVERGGKMVPFAGWLLPVQYTGVIEEHLAVREKAGLFDVSHMGEFLLTGPDALHNLNTIFTNEFTSMTDGKVRYTLLCNENGGIVDDMIVCRMAQDRYMIVPNAANREKDLAFIRAHLSGSVTLEDISDQVAQIALQGPKSEEILCKLSDKNGIPTQYYTFAEDVPVAGVSCLLSQTGYTGERGYELYCDPAHATKLWQALLEAGEEFGLIPCGLGARDTLRLEAGMPLYGHEMSDEISPLEANLAFAVKMAKEDFVGKKGLLSRGEPTRTRVGIQIIGRGIAREENPVFVGDRQIGYTTSGTHCPYLKGAYAMALVDAGHCAVGTQVQVEVRGRRIEGEIVPMPFYKRA